MSAQAYIDIQQQLLRILAHHMVYIADRVKLIDPNTAKDRLIQGSAFEWGRKALVQWMEVPGFKSRRPVHLSHVWSMKLVPWYQRQDKRSSLTRE